MAGERGGTMILAMFCLSNDEMIPQMAEAYGGVGRADGDGRWGGQRSLHSSALGFAIVGPVFGAVWAVCRFDLDRETP